MEFKGFKTGKDESGIIIEMVMPSILEETFFAKLYARGPLGDAAEGDPAAVWSSLGQTYHGRPLVAPHQVHGVRIIEASEEEVLPQRTEADGVFISAGSRPLARLHAGGHRRRGWKPLDGDPALRLQGHSAKHRRERRKAGARAASVAASRRNVGLDRAGHRQGMLFTAEGGPDHRARAEKFFCGEYFGERLLLQL